VAAKKRDVSEYGLKPKKTKPKKKLNAEVVEAQRRTKKETERDN
jgi:hypothetical protein